MRRIHALLVLTLLVVVLCWLVLRQPSTEPSRDGIVIGGVFELSGKYAQVGQSAQRGVQLAIAEINHSGGLLGKPLRLVSADSASSEDGALNAFKRLQQEPNLCAVIGPQISGLGIAIGPLADELQLPFIATVATHPRVTVDDTGRVHPYAFRACFIDSFQGGIMARFARERLQAKTAALYVDETSSYSRGLAAFFERSFGRLDGTIVSKAGYNPSAAHFADDIAFLLSSAPDVLFIPGLYSEVAQIIPLVRAAGFQKPIIGCDSWEETLLVTLVSPTVLNNTFYSSHYSSDDANPGVRLFAEKYRAFSNEEPQQPAVLAYDATMLLADAIRQAASDNRQAVRDRLEKTRAFPAISGSITFDEHHNAVKSAVIIEIKNGRGQFKERIQP